MWNEIKKWLPQKIIGWLLVMLLALAVIVLFLVVVLGRQFSVGLYTVAVHQPSRDIPVGTVISFWGRKNDIPKGFEVCDGELVTTPDSPLNKTRKPNLQDSFIKGALAEVVDVATNPEIGTTHTKDISHSHGAGELRALIGMHGRPAGFISMVPRGGRFGTEFEFAAPGAQRSGSAPEFGVAVDGNTEHKTLSVDVRPKFVSLFYIIKVK